MAKITKIIKKDGKVSLAVLFKERCETVQSFLHDTLVQESRDLETVLNSMSLNEDLVEELVVSIPYWMDDLKYRGSNEWIDQEKDSLGRALKAFETILVSTNFEEEEILFKP